MNDRPSVIQLALTPSQREHIQKVTGLTADSLQLRVEELEERIAPVAFQPWHSID